MSLRAIIVDDEKHSRETLQNLIEEFCKEVEIISTESNINDAVLAIKLNKPDLLFLDVELQTGTGFDILEQLDTLNFEVIFTTAFEQYALKAVKFSSLDYLLKPIDLDELQKAIDKAKKIKDKEVYHMQLEVLLSNLKKKDPKGDKICLSTSDGFEFVDIADIVYCKAEGSYTSFILKYENKFLVSKHLKEYENLLGDHSFMRVHNSFLINLREVKKYIKADGGYILMNNNDAVSISRNKKDEFLQIWS